MHCGNVSQDRMCVNISEADVQPHRHEGVFCSTQKVMKQRVDSGAAVREPYSCRFGRMLEK